MYINTNYDDVVLTYVWQKIYLNFFVTAVFPNSIRFQLNELVVIKLVFLSLYLFLSSS